MISLDHVSKAFKGKCGYTLALDDLCLSLPNKGMIFVTGESGSGKSTLLNLVAAFDKPTSGEIEVDGEDITRYKGKRLSRYHLEKIAFIFQDYGLLEELDVASNLSIGNKTPKKQMEEEIAEILERVGLEGYEEKKVKYLSGGERQRVAIARGLLKDAPFILADEPCGNLDRRSSKLVLDILKKESLNRLVLIVSHNLKDAFYYGDRVLKLEKGRLVEDLVYDERKANRKGYLLIKDLSVLSKKEVAELNRKIASKEILGLYSRRECFVPYQNAVPSEQTKEEAPRKAHFLSSVRRTLRGNLANFFAFSFLIGICLGLFSVCYTFNIFDPSSLNSPDLYTSSFNSVPYSKGKINQEGELDQNYTYPFEEGDLAKIEDSGYKGNAYPLYRIPISMSNNLGDTLSRQCQIIVNNFASFYSLCLGGVLTSPRDFWKQNLDLEELTIIEAEEIKDYGVYITDYAADSYSYMNPLRYRFGNREEVLGGHKNYGISTSPEIIYINGIIVTGYEERLASLVEIIEEDKELEELSEKEAQEYLADYEYLRNCLNIAYSDNENFLDSFINDFQTVYNVSRSIITGENADVDITLGSVYMGRCSNENMPENSLMIRYKVIDDEFYYGSTEEEIEEIFLSGTNFKLQNGTTVMEEGLGYQSSYEVSGVYLCEMHEDWWNSDDVNMYSHVNFYLEDSLFDKVTKDAYYAYTYYLDDIEGALKLQETLLDEDIYVNSTISSAMNGASSTMSSFSGAFRILCYASLAICLALIIFFSISNIRRRKYHLGVLKSLGYGSQELSAYYLGILLLFGLASMVFYLGAYGLGMQICDSLLHASINDYSSIAGLLVKGMTIVNLDMSLYLFTGMVFMGLLALLALIYLLALSYFKPVNILRKKE